MFKKIMLITVALAVSFGYINNLPVTYADGDGSSVACLDTTPNVLGSKVGTDDLVVVNVGAGFVVDGVCIKSGSKMFGGNKHSGVLVNGTFENNCYTVTGVGSQTVTVTRIGSGSNCQEISHIDVVFGEIEDQEEEPEIPEVPAVPGGTTLGTTTGGVVSDTAATTRVMPVGSVNAGEGISLAGVLTALTASLFCTIYGAIKMRKQIL